MFFFTFIITGTEFLLQKLCFIFIPKISNYLKPLLYNKLSLYSSYNSFKKKEKPIEQKFYRFSKFIQNLFFYSLMLSLFSLYPNV